MKIPVLAGAALPTRTRDCASVPREPVPTSSSSSSFLHSCSKWDGARREQGLQKKLHSWEKMSLSTFPFPPYHPKPLLRYFFSFVTCAQQESVNSKHAWDGIFPTGSCRWTCLGTWKDLASTSQTNFPQPPTRTTVHLSPQNLGFWFFLRNKARDLHFPDEVWGPQTDFSF